MSAVLAPSPTAKPHGRATSRLPHLLAVAARAFADRGFAAATVREIVEPVGMLPGSLYCHFPTKEALLVAVYREGVGRIGAAVEQAIAPLVDPWERLEAACVAHLASLLNDSEFAQVVIRVRPGDAPLVADELVALRDAYERRFARLVAALPLAKPADRSALRLLLMGAMNWSQTWYRPVGNAAPERIARRFVALLKSGPYPARRSTQRPSASKRSRPVTAASR